MGTVRPPCRRPASPPEATLRDIGPRSEACGSGPGRGAPGRARGRPGEGAACGQAAGCPTGAASRGRRAAVGLGPGDARALPGRAHAARPGRRVRPAGPHRLRAHPGLDGRGPGVHLRRDLDRHGRSRRAGRADALGGLLRDLGGDHRIPAALRGRHPVQALLAAGRRRGAHGAHRRRPPARRAPGTSSARMGGVARGHRHRAGPDGVVGPAGAWLALRHSPRRGHPLDRLRARLDDSSLAGGHRRRFSWSSSSPSTPPTGPAPKGLASRFSSRRCWWPASWGASRPAPSTWDARCSPSRWSRPRR